MDTDQILARLVELRERCDDPQDQDYQAREQACLFIVCRRGQFRAYMDELERQEKSNDLGVD